MRPAPRWPAFLQSHCVRLVYTICTSSYRWENRGTDNSSDQLTWANRLRGLHCLSSALLPGDCFLFLWCMNTSPQLPWPGDALTPSRPPWPSLCLTTLCVWVGPNTSSVFSCNTLVSVFLKYSSSPFSKLTHNYKGLCLRLTIMFWDPFCDSGYDSFRGMPWIRDGDGIIGSGLHQCYICIWVFGNRKWVK